jgi:phosphoribosyl 1,2-cyclic phosphodiesterase
VEIRLSNNQLFIFDAGTGIRELGNVLCKKNERLKVHIFLSHFHWDHIQGLPFFLPSYMKGNEIIIHGMNMQETRLDNIISNQMESIYFPVKLQSLAADIQFQLLSDGSNVIADAKVDSLYINHPGQAMGYVINFGKIKIGYFTDNELVPSGVDGTSRLKYKPDVREKILRLIYGADLLIHDAQYTDEEYKAKVGWGHSSLGETLQLAKDCCVKRLALFHHDPDHFDDQIDILVANCKERLNEYPYSLECFAAHEGMELHF